MNQAITPRHSRRILNCLAIWTGRTLERLSERIHAGGDATARENGWEITRATGRFGFGARIYHDPRFAHRALCTHRSDQAEDTPAASFTSHPGAAGAAAAPQPNVGDREEGTHVRDHSRPPR
jgi:hypothetical protein